MKGIILCQFRGDQPDVHAALTRCLGWPVVAGRAQVLFMAATAKAETTGFDRMWAISTDSQIEAEAMVKTWSRNEPDLRNASICCLTQTDNQLMDASLALFP